MVRLEGGPQVVDHSLDLREWGPKAGREVNSRVIGRGLEAAIVVAHAEVSRRHASLIRTPEGWLLEDLGSANGTFLEGQRLAPGEALPLVTGARVGIGPVEFRFHDGRLEPIRGDDSTEPGAGLAAGSDNGRHVCASRAAMPNPVRVDVCGLTQWVGVRGRPLTLLQDVRFTVLPNELVAIIGASGAGKSTLINALNGMRPAVEGQVLYNGAPFYADIEAFRSAIGYVPQEDIVHRELPVHSVLKYASRLRLPEDMTDDEVDGRIDEILAELELGHRRDAIVSTLSGGERKRVNIAVELLTRPSLLLLDEPTSGLDPGLERRVVALIRRLTEEGRTILFVTHATESIAQCDLVLFLARGGRVAFYGPPAEALRFFGVDEFAEAYLQLSGVEDGENPWPERFRQSAYYREYVEGRQAELPPAPRAAPRRAGEGRSPVSPLRQFGTLARRYLDVMRGDPRNLLIMLLQAPFIATILSFLYKSNTFTNDQPTSPGASPPVKDATELLFLVVIAALWFGTINAAREISKERAIFLRERLASVRIWPYLWSKVAILSLLCLIQSVLLLGIVGARVPLTDDPGTWWALLATVFLTSLAATLQGLAMSSMASSTDQSMSLAPVVVLPQVIFSGMLVGLNDLGPLRAVANLMPGRWAYGGLCALTDLKDLFTQTGIGRHAKDVFDTEPASALAALGVISVLCLLAAAGALAVRERR